MYGNWREYQEAVAEVFRKLGCNAEVNKTVCGARGSHDVDVYVTFEKFGYECRWIIECKLWSTRVDRSAVLTLQSITQNVGADRGLIFSESGFQSGAQTAAQNTNVLLQTSLDHFRQQRTCTCPLSRLLSKTPTNRMHRQSTSFQTDPNPIICSGTTDGCLSAIGASLKPETSQSSIQRLD